MRQSCPLLVVDGALEKLEIWQSIRVQRHLLGDRLAEPFLTQFRNRKPRYREDVIQVELISKIDEREQQRQKRKGAFVTV